MSASLMMLHAEVYSITPPSRAAGGRWPEPLQQQPSQKNYADVGDVNMTYFEALQRACRPGVFLPRWPIACTSSSDTLLYVHTSVFNPFTDTRLSPAHVLIHYR